MSVEGWGSLEEGEELAIWVCRKDHVIQVHDRFGKKHKINYYDRLL